MAKTSCQYKEVKNGVVELHFFDGENHCANRVKEPTGKKPKETPKRKCCYKWFYVEDNQPPHSDIKYGREYFKSAYEKQFQNSANQRNTPYQRKNKHTIVLPKCN